MGSCYPGGCCRSSHSVLTGGCVYRKGDTVVHPEHGAAIIEDLRERNFIGERKKYFVLKLAYGDLTLMVTVDNTKDVVLREVVSMQEVKMLHDLLREDELTIS